MSWATVMGLALVLAILVTLVVAAAKVAGRVDDAARKSEIERLKKELNDEIHSGGNISRIVALRQRLRKLGAQ